MLTLSFKIAETILSESFFNLTYSSKYKQFIPLYLIIIIISLSLYLSHTHTHTHTQRSTHTHTEALTHRSTHTHKLIIHTHTISLSHTHTNTHYFSLKHTLIHAHLYTHTHTRTNTYTLSLSHTNYLSLKLKHTHSYTHTHAHVLTTKSLVQTIKFVWMVCCMLSACHRMILYDLDKILKLASHHHFSSFSLSLSGLCVTYAFLFPRLKSND